MNGKQREASCETFLSCFSQQLTKIQNSRKSRLCLALPRAASLCASCSLSFTVEHLVSCSVSASGRPVLVEGEVELQLHSNTQLYDKKKKTQHTNGTSYLTTHRFAHLHSAQRTVPSSLTGSFGAVKPPSALRIARMAQSASIVRPL